MGAKRTENPEDILTKHHRFEFLDAMRGVAAVFVVAWHMPPTMQKLLPFNTSFLAVDLFFCLSGFVIAFSYERRLQAGMPFRTFCLARAIRLYPLYALGTVLGIFALLGRSLFLAPGERSLSAIVSALIFSIAMLPTVVGKHLPNAAFPLNPPAWSLFFEIFANLLYALLVIWRIASSLLLILFAVAMLAITTHHVFLRDGPFDVGATSASLLFGIPRIGYSFFVGVLLVRLYGAHLSLRFPARLAAPVAALVLTTMVILLIGPYRASGSPRVQLVVASTIIPCLVFAGAAIQVGPRWKRLCLRLGEFSYPLYILHLPLLAPLYLVQKLHVSGLFYEMLAPLSILILIPLSLWVAFHYDAPVRSYLTQKFVPRSSTHTILTDPSGAAQ